MDINVMRGVLHQMASDLRSASQALDDAVGNQDGVPPDAGQSTPLVGESLAQLGMTVGNLNEMVVRAAADVEASAKTYTANEDNGVDIFKNLTPDAKSSQPKPSKPK